MVIQIIRVLCCDLGNFVLPVLQKLADQKEGNKWSEVPFCQGFYLITKRFHNTRVLKGSIPTYFKLADLYLTLFFVHFYLNIIAPDPGSLSCCIKSSIKRRLMTATSDFCLKVSIQIDATKCFQRSNDGRNRTPPSNRARIVKQHWRQQVHPDRWHSDGHGWKSAYRQSTSKGMSTNRLIHVWPNWNYCYY